MNRNIHQVKRYFKVIVLIKCLYKYCEDYYFFYWLDACGLKLAAVNDQWGLAHDLNGNTTQKGTQFFTYMIKGSSL